MKHPDPTDLPHETPPAPAMTPDASPTPRTNLHDAIGWIVLGIAIVVLSWRMDRMEEFHINPLTIPGLVPGLLGLGMVIIGAIMLLRAVQRGGLREPAAVRPPAEHVRRKRAGLAILLCCGYSLVLIGHGLPFWLASAIYVTAAILTFDRISPDPAKRAFSRRGVVRALMIAIIASVVIWLVFERLFLVRLP